MSAIQKELIKVLDLEAPKKASERQAFLADAVKGIHKLGDKDWDALSAEAQNWFNTAADAKNAKKDELPDFPDLEKEEEEAPKRRRSAAAAEDDEAQEVEVTAKELKAGMAIKLVTKRGKEATGHVIEVTKDGVLGLKLGNGDEVDYELDRIETMTTLKAAEKEEEAPKRRRSAAAEEEPADPVKVGAKVTIKTKRGKEESGEIVEMDDDILVLKVGKEEVEFSRKSVESITVEAVKEEGGRRRAAAAEDGKEEKKQRSSNPEGVSVGTRITELMAEDMDATEEQIGKQLKKEGIEFRENTLSLNFKATKKTFDILRAKKLLKA